MPFQEAFQDELLVRQVEVLRFGEGLEGRAIQAIDASEQQIADLLRERLTAIGRGGGTATPAQIRRVESLIDRVKDVRTSALRDAATRVRGELRALSVDEARVTRRAFDKALGVPEIKLKAPAQSAIRKATFGTPYAGRKFNQWTRGLERDDLARISGAIRQGFLDGDDVESIVRRVRGTVSLGATDGATQITRRAVKAWVGTSISHFSNGAREAVLGENQEKVIAYKWVSVLDGRTSAICRFRSARIAPIPGKRIPKRLRGLPRLKPPGARPPAHPHCRSQIMPLWSSDGLVKGLRGVVEKTEDGTIARDFRREARQSKRHIAAVRAEWARERGLDQLPSDRPFPEWLEGLSAARQDEILGPVRGKLHREGSLTLERFTDKTGRKYTLDELRKREAQAFDRAEIA